MCVSQLSSSLYRILPGILLAYWQAPLTAADLSAVAPGRGRAAVAAAATLTRGGGRQHSLSTVIKSHRLDYKRYDTSGWPVSNPR